MIHKWANICKPVISNYDNLPAVWGQDDSGGVVKEYTYRVIGQLETKAVLVGIVHPFAHP